METDEGDLDTLEDVTEATVVKRPEVTIHIEYIYFPPGQTYADVRLVGAD